MRAPERFKYAAAHPITKEITPMNRNHIFIATALAVAVIGSCGAALAQAPVPSGPSTVAQVETWTTQYWEAAKAKWAQNATKWTDCKKQLSARKLEGHGSWSFIYTCMTS
jgi:hypothetical protein